MTDGPDAWWPLPCKAAAAAGAEADEDRVHSSRNAFTPRRPTETNVAIVAYRTHGLELLPLARSSGPLPMVEYCAISLLTARDMWSADGRVRGCLCRKLWSVCARRAPRRCDCCAACAVEARAASGLARVCKSLDAGLFYVCEPVCKS